MSPQSHVGRGGLHGRDRRARDVDADNHERLGSHVTSSPGNPGRFMIDGHAGLRKAVGLVWPDARVQRCAVHKLRNVERKAPKHALAEIRADFHRIDAETAATARTAYATFVRKWAPRCPGVVPRRRRGTAHILRVSRSTGKCGCGGGVIHVPFLIVALSLPVHVATATSHFVLSISAFVGAVTYLALGHVRLLIAGVIGVGILLGAQVGARLSLRVQGVMIRRILASALILVGARMIWHALK